MKKTKKNHIWNKTKFIVEFAVALALLAGTLGYRPDFLSDIQSFVQEKTDPAYTRASGDLQMQAIDVGQGQAVLFYSDGKYMLVDGGDSKYSSYLVSYLKKLGITELEYIVASHYDDDHLNGLIGALYAFQVHNVIAPGYVADTKTYTSFCNAVAGEGLTAILPKTGDTYTFGTAQFTIVSETDLMNKNQDSENNSSIAIRVTNKAHSFLVTGDAQEQAEDAMMDSGEWLQADVYVAGHHGSGGSSSEEFLDQVDPDVAVISCGKDNSYGHPAERVVDSLESRDVTIYRTDIDGTVAITSNERELKVETHKDNYEGQ